MDSNAPGNNANLAKCEGKRVESTNEAFNKDDAQTMFNPTTLVQLLGLDQSRP